jgi:hypothetical protein
MCRRLNGTDPQDRDDGPISSDETHKRGARDRRPREQMTMISAITDLSDHTAQIF